MKLLNCLKCHDTLAVIPQEIRTCLCGKSKAMYSTIVRKEVYSGTYAVLLGINDDDLFALKDHLSVEPHFYKSIWVTISPSSSTVLKVRDVAKWKPKKLKGHLTSAAPRRYNGSRRSG